MANSSVADGTGGVLAPGHTLHPWTRMATTCRRRVACGSHKTPPAKAACRSWQAHTHSIVSSGTPAMDGRHLGRRALPLVLVVIRTSHPHTPEGVVHAIGNRCRA